MNIKIIRPKNNGHIKLSTPRQQLFLFGMIRGKMQTIAVVKFWGKERVWCWLSITCCGNHATGRGYAGGYGYNKKLAALESALISAGVEFDYCPSVEGVLQAIAEYFDASQFMITGG